MFSEQKKQEFYQAILAKDIEYDGVFYVGVTTTGIFCRPTCSARKPKFTSCEFYKSSEEALKASFRPCLRCTPLLSPNCISDVVRILVEAMDLNPDKKWTEQDFKDLSVDSSTVRRQFKKRFGMTFIAYVRARRMEIAKKKIQEGSTIIEAQLEVGYNSSSGFREAFAKIMGASPTSSEKYNHVLTSSWLDTPLGPMLAIADEKFLYLLEFVGRRGLKKEVEKLKNYTKAVILPGNTEIIESIEKEIAAYFAGTLKSFKTPLYIVGSPFQKIVWNELLEIPYGETRSYQEQSIAIEKPTACRAVANANGTNQFAIVIPCHRIIHNDGTVGGYGGGAALKSWLLEHEKNYKEVELINPKI